MHAKPGVPCTAFGKVSIKPLAGKLRNAEDTAACGHLVGLEVPVKLIVSLRTDNDEVRAVAGALAPLLSDGKAISQLPPAHYLSAERMRSLYRKCWARPAW